MPIRITQLLVIAASSVLWGFVAGAQSPQDTGGHERINPKLAAQAKITKDSARRLALAQVPGATVQSMELEREHGKLIYSFDLKVAGKPGVEEVNVSAINGAIIARHHESARAERREAARERRARRARRAKPQPKDSTTKR